MQIGIIINNLGPSQIAFDAVKNLNSIADTNSVCMFYQNLARCTYPVKFATLNYNKIYSSYFDSNSVLIATNISSALDLSRVNNGSKKLFYAYDLEFLDNKDFARNVKGYNCLPLYTRSESYRQAIKNYANIDAKVVPFNIKDLLWTLNTLKINM